ncbi:MAG: hypothetical protein S4CHLAM37_05750 [Chlamydiia bacterium]|nr:hypothetical protein [Chlamydiia bacterium]
MATESRDVTRRDFGATPPPTGQERSRPPGGLSDVPSTLEKAQGGPKKKARHTKGAAAVEAGEAHFPIGKKFPITKAQIDTVRGIVAFMNEQGMTGLALPRNATFVKAEGKKVELLHPLCFLYSLSIDKASREYLRGIKSQWITVLWNSFLGYSTFSSEGLGRELVKVFGESSFVESEPMLHAFYKAAGLDKVKMDLLAKAAFSEQAELRRLQKDPIKYSDHCIWEAFILQALQER